MQTWRKEFKDSGKPASVVVKAPAPKKKEAPKKKKGERRMNEQQKAERRYVVCVDCYCVGC